MTHSWPISGWVEGPIQFINEVVDYFFVDLVGMDDARVQSLVHKKM